MCRPKQALPPTTLSPLRLRATFETWRPAEGRMKPSWNQGHQWQDWPLRFQIEPSSYLPAWACWAPAPLSCQAQSQIDTWRAKQNHVKSAFSYHLGTGNLFPHSSVANFHRSMPNISGALVSGIPLPMPLPNMQSADDATYLRCWLTQKFPTNVCTKNAHKQWGQIVLRCAVSISLCGHCLVELRLCASLAPSTRLGEKPLIYSGAVVPDKSSYINCKGGLQLVAALDMGFRQGTFALTNFDG